MIHHAADAMQLAPFGIAIPDGAISDLKERLARTRWPDQLENTGWDSGTEVSYLRALVGYWREDFDWRAQEARLNRLGLAG